MWQAFLIQFGEDESGTFWTGEWQDCTAAQAALLCSPYVPIRLI